MTFRAAFYKGTRPGLQGLYSIVVSRWMRGPYSHCELVFSDGLSASASFIDGGVRFKAIEYDPEHWDFIELPAALEPAACKWFEAHEHERYDLLGNLHFVIGFVPDSKRGKFCSEALAAALGIPDPWRFDPNALATVLRYLHQPATAGFFITCDCNDYVPRSGQHGGRESRHRCAAGGRCQPELCGLHAAGPGAARHAAVAAAADRGQAVDPVPALEQGEGGR